MEKDIKQIIIVRKDLIELSDCELDLLSKDRRDQYYKELNSVGKMGKGKLAAQVAHASLAPILMYMRNNINYKDYTPPKNNYSLELNLEKNSDLTLWLEGSFTKIVLYVKSEEKLLSINNELNKIGILNEVIEDKGLTSFKKPTITCLGIIPIEYQKIKDITKKLRLLN